MNKFFGIGYLGGDPEPLSKGCKLSLATEIWDGTQSKVIWLKVMVFGTSATNCLEHLTKGRRILVEGRVDIALKSGNMIIVTDNITFL